MEKQVNHWSKLALVAVGLLVVIALATGCSGAIGGSSAGEGVVNYNTITVTGSGDATGAPDVAYIQLGVNVSDANAGTAIDEANTIITAVRAALIQAGVADEDIQTTSFNVYSEDLYDPLTGQPSGEVRYHVQNILNVTVRDVATTGAVLDAALSAGANNVLGLSFSISDTSALEADARAQAIEDARARAQQLADVLGVTLGEPVVVSETFFGPGPVFTGGLGGGGGAAPAEVPVSAGQLTVSVQVNVTFAISR